MEASKNSLISALSVISKVFYILRSFVLAKLLVLDNIFTERLGFLNGHNVLLVAFFGAKSS